MKEQTITTPPIPNVMQAMIAGDVATVKAWLNHPYIGAGNAMNQVAHFLMARLELAQASAPAVSGEAQGSCLDLWIGKEHTTDVLRRVARRMDVDSADALLLNTLADRLPAPPSGESSAHLCLSVPCPACDAAEYEEAAGGASFVPSDAGTETGAPSMLSPDGFRGRLSLARQHVQFLRQSNRQLWESDEKALVHMRGCTDEDDRGCLYLQSVEGLERFIEQVAAALEQSEQARARAEAACAKWCEDIDHEIAAVFHYKALAEQAESKRSQALALLAERNSGLSKMQEHRDQWRCYAYGRCEKPNDFIDGNMLNRSMTAIEQADSQRAALQAERDEAVKEREHATAIANLRIELLRADLSTLHAAHARMREALEDCVDSLEYVERNAPTLSGYGVRQDRIKAAKTALSESQPVAVRACAEGWEPIATAPRDGTFVFVTDEDESPQWRMVNIASFKEFSDGSSGWITKVTIASAERGCLGVMPKPTAWHHMIQLPRGLKP